MAKRKKKSTKAYSSKRAAVKVQNQPASDEVTNENAEIETSDIVLTEVKNKPSKEERKQAKLAEKQAKQKAKAKAAANAAPKRNRIKEVFSELKKVNWPSFKKTCKQTGAVLIVVVIFMAVVLGIDSLLGWIITLIGKI